MRVSDRTMGEALARLRWIGMYLGIDLVRVRVIKRGVRVVES